MEIGSPFKDRRLEFDGLAWSITIPILVALVLAAYWLCLSLDGDKPVIAAAASVAVSAGVLAAWVLGYPQRSAIPSVSFVLVCALAAAPIVFDISGPLLRDTRGVAPSTLSVVVGLYVGGLGLIMMGFALFGFILPLIGAIRAVLRKEHRAQGTLLIHVALALGALAAIIVARSAARIGWA